MFNNPLKKYQQGDQLSTEEAENQMAQALAEAFQMDPQAVKTRIQEIRQNPKESKLFAQGLQMLQQGDQQNGMAILGELFKVASHKKGGKIDAFICKHKKGGVAGCGCKEDGGKVEKAEMGLGGLNDHSPRPAKVDVPLIPGILAELRQRKVANSGNAVNRNFSKANWKGNQYFLERADIGGNTADTWIQVTPDLDTLVQQQLPSGRYTPLTQEQAQSIVNRNRTDINKQEDGGVVKGEEGVTTPTLSRREALSAAKNTFGFSGSQARRAYANAKKGLRAQGLRGSELKQRAREMMFNMPIISDDITIEDPEIQLPEMSVLETSVPTVQPITPVVSKDPLANMTDEQLAQAVLAGKYGNGAARRQALGDRYGAVQQIINHRFSKPTSPAGSPAAILPNASASSNTPKVLTTPASSNEQLYGSVPGGFIPQNTQGDSNFHINSNRPASSFGARQSIINRQVKDYIDGAGLGIGTDIVFDNGRYIWKSSGTPVEVPMVGRNGNYRPVVERSGGVLKGQNSIPGGMPEIPEENKIYSEKNTMVKGPSIGQRGLGVKRPWLAQTISFNPFSAQNDTSYTGRNLEAFIPGYRDDLLKIRYSALPPAVKKNLAKAIDSDYEEYNSTYGSYPNNYYEKTITVKKRK